jgi:hypothetical protein
VHERPDFLTVTIVGLKINLTEKKRRIHTI